MASLDRRGLLRSLLVSPLVGLFRRSETGAPRVNLRGYEWVTLEEGMRQWSEAPGDPLYIGHWSDTILVIGDDQDG